MGVPQWLMVGWYALALLATMAQLAGLEGPEKANKRPIRGALIALFTWAIPVALTTWGGFWG